MEEMRKLYGNKTNYVIRGNQLADYVAKTHAERKLDRAEPYREQSRFSDPCQLRVPADITQIRVNATTAYKCIVDWSMLYKLRVDYEWKHYSITRERECRQKNKPIFIDIAKEALIDKD